MFCSKPFEWMEVAPGGDIFLCCPSWLPKKVGNVLQDPDVWNNEAAQEIRRSILDNSFKFCKNCPYLMNKNGPVSEQPQNPRLISVVKNKITKLDGPKWINLAYDLSCNLSCPSCRLEKIQISGRAYEKCKEIQDVVLNSYKDGLEWIYITGSGDPFGSKLFRELLTTLKPSDMPGVRIYLHTNAILLNEKMWTKISNINSIIKQIQVSIDAATSATYSLNRLQNGWERLQENLQFIKQLRDTGSIDCFEISFVVQKNNWREMKDFVLLGKKLNVDRIIFSPLDDWNRGCFFSENAIHEKKHPDHKIFVESLYDSIFLNPTVNLGVLTKLVDVKWL